MGEDPNTFNVSLGFRSKLSLINYDWLRLHFIHLYGSDNSTFGADNELGSIIIFSSSISLRAVVMVKIIQAPDSFLCCSVSCDPDSKLMYE